MPRLRRSERWSFIRRVTALWCLIVVGLSNVHVGSPAQAATGHAEARRVRIARRTPADQTSGSPRRSLSRRRRRGLSPSPHCRVSGVIDKEIRFTELLPDRWNERLFAGGGGGFVGSVQNQAVASVNFGYARSAPIRGTRQTASTRDGRFGNRERQINYGYLAIHRTAEIAKAIVKAYYGVDPKYAYFFGCSNGGRQALMEAQRFPGDFDGVVSCAPALDFTNIAASFVRNTQAVYPDPQGASARAISPDNLRLLESKVLDACDARDGVKDGVLDDPRECHFRIASTSGVPGGSGGRRLRDARPARRNRRVYSPATSRGTVIYPDSRSEARRQQGGWHRGSRE